MNWVRSEWAKASASDGFWTGSGYNCVQTCLAWRSASPHITCVELSTTVEDGTQGTFAFGQLEETDVPAHKAALGERLILMRDSKDPDGPVLAFTAAEIAAFFNGVRNGEFSYLLTEAELA